MARVRAAHTNFSAVLAALADHGHLGGDEEVNLLRASFAPNTLKQYSSAWRCFVRANTPHHVVPFCTAHVITYARSVAARSERPGPSISQLQTVVSLVTRLSAGALLNPFDTQPLLARLLDGLTRTETARGRLLTPLLDISKVLRFLRIHHRPELPVRDHVIAAYAAVVPSRPAELAHLQLRDISVVLPVHQLGVADIAHSLNTLLCNPLLRKLLPDATCQFRLVCRLIDSKTDRRSKAGIDKILQHPAGHSWSPALALVHLALLAHRRCSVATSNNSAQFGKLLLFAQHGRPDSALTADSVSNALARVARAATGTRAKARSWRPAAATWLLTHGVPEATVVALGGWVNADSLRRYYIRAAPLSDDLVSTIIASSPVQRARPAATPTNPSPVLRDSPSPAGQLSPHSVARRRAQPDATPPLAPLPVRLFAPFPRTTPPPPQPPSRSPDGLTPITTPSNVSRSPQLASGPSAAAQQRSNRRRSAATPTSSKPQQSPRPSRQHRPPQRLLDFDI